MEASKVVLGFPDNNESLNGGRFIIIRINGEFLITNENDLAFDKKRKVWVPANACQVFKFLVGDLTPEQKEEYDGHIHSRKLVHSF